MRDPARFGAIIERIEAVTLDYLSAQVEAGAEALQLFDSWAGSLSPAQFEQWVIAPTARLVDRARRRGIPTFPSSAFPRARAASSPPMRARPASTRSGSTRRSIRSGRRRSCREDLPLQGNLDPLALIAGGEPLEGRVEANP